MELYDVSETRNQAGSKTEYEKLTDSQKERYEKLHKMIIKYEAGTLDFKTKCPLDLLKKQASNMGQYLYCLEIRAEIEKIPLNYAWEKLDIN